MTRIRLSDGKCGDTTLDTELTDELLQVIHQFQMDLKEYGDTGTISTGNPLQMPEGSDGHHGVLTPDQAVQTIALWVGIVDVDESGHVHLASTTNPPVPGWYEPRIARPHVD